MREIKRYLSDDGTVWSLPDDAERQDVLAARVAEAMLPLGDLPLDKGCAFANGGGYVWHRREAVETATRALIDVFRSVHPKLWADDADPYDRRVSHFARIADDAPGAMAVAFGRLMRIDDEGREWGQPFYATNPGRGTDYVWEDRR